MSLFRKPTLMSTIEELDKSLNSLAEALPQAAEDKKFAEKNPNLENIIKSDQPIVAFTEHYKNLYAAINNFYKTFKSIPTKAPKGYTAEKREAYEFAEEVNRYETAILIMQNKIAPTLLDIKLSLHAAHDPHLISPEFSDESSKYAKSIIKAANALEKLHSSIYLDKPGILGTLFNAELDRLNKNLQRLNHEYRICVAVDEMTTGSIVKRGTYKTLCRTYRKGRNALNAEPEEY